MWTEDTYWSFFVLFCFSVLNRGCCFQVNPEFSWHLLINIFVGKCHSEMVHNSKALLFFFDFRAVWVEVMVVFLCDYWWCAEALKGPLQEQFTPSEQPLLWLSTLLATSICPQVSATSQDTQGCYYTLLSIRPAPTDIKLIEPRWQEDKLFPL